MAALDAIEASTAAGSTAANQTAGNTLLTAISSALAGILSVFTKNVQVTGNLTVADPTGNTAGSTVTINTDSIGGLGIKIAGSGVGTILFQGSVDGVTWDNPKVYPISVGAQGVTSTTTIGDFEANPGAFKQFRVCLSALSSGTFSVTFNGTAAIKHVGVKNGNAADLNATVVSAGSVGQDHSANQPALPVVGQPFAAAGPYASYVLIATVPASPSRNNVDIENTSGAQIAVVRDDGTAASGAAPANASVFALGGGSAAGAQGGAWSSQTFKGRLQIYAPSSTAIVSVMVD
ncbi:hypothetical protein [Paraburkholderia phenazinium]|uniref:hypothetical protein n=1 Tax=Paraburkholderia phenazinium TaxID=60549 RepID=UPI00115FDBDA|nr:hypothetical protein [Paraburkholderia phenazinium]